MYLRQRFEGNGLLLAVGLPVHGKRSPIGGGLQRELLQGIGGL